MISFRFYYALIQLLKKSKNNSVNGEYASNNDQKQQIWDYDLTNIEHGCSMLHALFLFLTYLLYILLNNYLLSAL